MVEQGQPIGEGLLEKKQEVEVVCMGEAGKADEQSEEARPTYELKQISEVSDTLRRAGGEIVLEEEDGRSAGLLEGRGEDELEDQHDKEAAE